jgi:hypothetical protein
MTPNEATLTAGLGAAIVAALVAWRVALYTVKNGPNYDQQLNDLRVEVRRLSDTHEGMLSHQKQVTSDEKKRREAREWTPTSSCIEVDTTERANYLIIKSDIEFAIDEVSIRTQSGAQVAQIPVHPSMRGVSSKGMRFLIPQDTLLALVRPDPEYLQYGKTVGQLFYVLRVNGTRKELHLPFRATQDFSTNQAWTRLEG